MHQIIKVLDGIINTHRLSIEIQFNIGINESRKIRILLCYERNAYTSNGLVKCSYQDYPMDFIWTIRVVFNFHFENKFLSCHYNVERTFVLYGKQHHFCNLHGGWSFRGWFVESIVTESVTTFKRSVCGNLKNLLLH